MSLRADAGPISHGQRRPFLRRPSSGRSTRVDAFFVCTKVFRNERTTQRKTMHPESNDVYRSHTGNETEMFSAHTVAAQHENEITRFGYERNRRIHVEHANLGSALTTGHYSNAISRCIATRETPTAGLITDSAPANRINTLLASQNNNRDEAVMCASPKTCTLRSVSNQKEICSFRQHSLFRFARDSARQSRSGEAHA